MANGNTYTWKFPAIDVYKQQGSYSDVVYNIHWRLAAIDQSATYSAEVYGVQSVSPYNPDSGSFIPYENLTQEIVTSWVLGSMGEGYGNITSSLDSQIENQINPPTLQLPPPWTNITPTPTPIPTVTPTPEPSGSTTPAPQI